MRGRPAHSVADLVSHRLFSYSQIRPMKKEYDFSLGKRGAVLSNAGKTRISIYLDNKVLQRFKAESVQAGKGYQTLINEALSQKGTNVERPVTVKEVRKIVREELVHHAESA